MIKTFKKSQSGYIEQKIISKLNKWTKEERNKELSKAEKNLISEVILYIASCDSIKEVSDFESSIKRAIEEVF